MPQNKEGSGTGGQRDKTLVWHRVGWNHRARGKSSSKNASATLIECETGASAQALTEPYIHKGNVYIKHHCHTHTYDRNQSHSIRTTLHMPWRLGMHGVPPPHTNLRGFCGELDDELSHINSTLKSVQEKLGVLEDEDEKEDDSDVLDWSSIHKRRHLTKSVANQMEFFTQRMNEWSHNPYATGEASEGSTVCSQPLEAQQDRPHPK